jgi:hypothetical protein
VTESFFFISLGLLGISWFISPPQGLGRKKIILVFFLRCLWVLPFLGLMHPKAQIQEIPQGLKKYPLSILIDDSESMPPYDGLGELTQNLLNLGFDPQIKTLSQSDPQGIRDGYTPLKDITHRWLGSLPNRETPWILITDGGDESPHKPWLGEKAPNGWILDLSQEGTNLPNLRIHSFKVPQVAFEGAPIGLSFVLGRTGPLEETSYEIQLIEGTEVLHSEFVGLGKHEKETTHALSLPPLEKGAHLFKIRVLPVGGETRLWDNEAYGSLDILTNTLGVLHILGEPSFDGRFLRRFLKSEPKYDVVSFYILRDPMDGGAVAERELSLIPFPVEQLFTEELKNFRVVILQNFQMFQFLNPKYQMHLVEFIKNGGSLLFIGGPRALWDGDRFMSPLRDILPFRVPDSDTLKFDENLSYALSQAQASPKERALASIYDDLTPLIPLLEKNQGIHRVGWKHLTDQVTPLIRGVPAEGGDGFPIALASYPGKGRAIWLLTDHLWAQALDPSKSRSLYQDFFRLIFTWLQKDETRQPLEISSFTIRERSGEIHWQGQIRGAALTYLAEGQWSHQVCGIQQKPFPKVGPSHVMDLEGSLTSPGQDLCPFALSATHPAFGSLDIKAHAPIIRAIPDRELKGGSRDTTEELAQKTGANLVSSQKALLASVEASLTRSDPRGDGPLLRVEAPDSFWFFSEFWFWIALSGAFWEVLIRRKVIF